MARTARRATPRSAARPGAGAGTSAPPAPADDAASSRPQQTVASLSARLGVAYGAEESLWTSITVAGCGRVGPLCLGLQIRGSFDPGVSGESEDTLAVRGGIDGLATLEVPVVVGPVVLRPGVGCPRSPRPSRRSVPEAVNVGSRIRGERAVVGEWSRPGGRPGADARHHRIHLCLELLAAAIVVDHEVGDRDLVGER